jgi:hypothetical protein
MIIRKTRNVGLWKRDDTPPHSLKNSNTSPKVEIIEGVGVGSLARSISGVKGCAGVPGWGLG